MAVRYASQQQGVMDGTNVPANKADGRQVNADVQKILASKLAGTDAWNSGDKVYLGFKPEGRKISAIRVTTDTSFGTSTLSIGIGDDPRVGSTIDTANKYVDAATHTTPLNRPTVIGPVASTLDDEPGDGEHLWLSVGVANIAAAVVATIEIETVGIS
jgi:hypothetical protein